MERFADVSSLTCLKLNFSVFAPFNSRKASSSPKLESHSLNLPRIHIRRILILILLMKLSKYVFPFLSFSIARTPVRARIISWELTTVASQFGLLPVLLSILYGEQELFFKYINLNMSMLTLKPFDGLSSS